MKRVILVTAALLVPSAAGCRETPRTVAQSAPSSSTTRPDAGRGMAAPGRDLVEGADAAAIVRQFCGYLRTTDSDYVARRVTSELRSSCERELLPLVADEKVAVSTGVWARCSSYAQSRTGPVDHGIRDAFPCKDLFVGRLARGARCDHALTCSVGLYCDDLTTHACVPRLAEGAACVATLTGNPCAPGLFCAADVCRRLPKRGEACRGFCDGPSLCIEHVCRDTPGELGESCQPGVDGCREGLRCTARMRCEPRLPAGAECTVTSDCASGACWTPPRVGPTTCR